MRITRVKYKLIKDENRPSLLAICSVVLDDCLMLNDLEVLNGKLGIYVIMPRVYSYRQKDKDDKKAKEFYHPLDKEFFSKFSKVILDGYKKAIKTGELSYIPKEGELNG